MRKILLSLSVLFCFAASAQYQNINRPLQYVNTFGYQYERFHAMYLMGLPNDTVAVPALLQNIPFIANKSGSIYLWNTSTLVWDLFSSGGGMSNPMTTANDIIVGGSGGTPLRLGIGPEGKVLGVEGGVLTYMNPNLIVKRAGDYTGQQGFYKADSSLYIKDTKGSAYIGVTTGTDSSKVITLLSIPVSYVIAASDETTDITTGIAKVTFRMPHAMTITAVRASINTVSSSGLPTIDINESGATILSTKITIDVGEKTSTTAATPPVISDTSLADDAEITIDIDVSGTGAKGLKVIITGIRTI